METIQQLDRRNTCHDTVEIGSKGEVTPAAHIWDRDAWPHGTCKCGRYRIEELPSARFAMVRTVIRGI